MDQRQFLATSDFPNDKIIFLASGSFVVPDTTFDATPGINIPHGLPFSPLPILVWSNTPDFTIANTYQDAAMIQTYFDTQAGQQYTVSSDSTNVTILRYNYAGSSQTVYYRIFCFAPSTADINSVVEFTADKADTFVYNSGYNYMKLVKVGNLTTGSPTAIHGLGYTPRAMVWADNSPVNLPQLIDDDPTGSGGATSGIFIDTAQIKWLNPNSYSGIEYRIYLDA